jgi:hypothetical protein
MPESVTINRRTLVSDGFGGYQDAALVTVAEDVPARLTEAQTQAMPGQLDRALLIDKWTVRMPYGTDLQEEDLIVWGDKTLVVETVKERSWDSAVTAVAEVVR